MDFSGFEVLTFDCYGTLIDWEAGLLGALQPVFRSHGVTMGDDAVLELFASLESAAEAGDYQPYKQVLEQVVRGMGAELGFEPSEEEARCLVDSLGDWPPFADTVPALRWLKREFLLGVVSNVDEDLFARTEVRLGVEFDQVITAERARSYKPSLRNFEVAVEVLGVEKDQMLHVAQSLFHDIGPAGLLGIATVWVDRRMGRGGGGATRLATAQPDVTVPDLSSLVALIGATSV